MKKIIAISMLIVLLFTGISIANENSRFEDLNLFYPSQISSWLFKNIRFVEDVGEYWQSPIETLNRKKGDCEDFAFLTQELLNQIDINSVVVGVVNSYVYDNIPHMVCIFEYNGQYRVMDNYKYWKFPKEYKSIEDIVEKYFQGEIACQYNVYPTEKNKVDTDKLDPEVQKILDDIVQDLLEKHIESMQRGEWDEIYGGEITWNTKIPKY